MQRKEHTDPRQMEILIVVTYAVKRRISGCTNYCDFATLLKLAMLAKDEAAATEPSIPGCSP